MKFVIIPELKGRWLWELRGHDGVPISRSPSRFSDRAEVMFEIRKMKLAVGRAKVFDLVGSAQDDALSLVPNLLAKT